jgi:hypothetical protein
MALKLFRVNLLLQLNSVGVTQLMRKRRTKLDRIIPTLNIILKSLFIARGSPSLVGRGIANPMFERTRGFKSHSPRYTCGFQGIIHATSYAQVRFIERFLSAKNRMRLISTDSEYLGRRQLQNTVWNRIKGQL